MSKNALRPMSTLRSPDRFIALLHSAGLGSGDEASVATEELISLCQAASVAMEAMPEVMGSVTLPNALSNAIHGVRSLMQGVLGLLTPRPGVANLDDVTYVFPLNATTAKLMKDVPRLGRVVLMKLRQSKVRCLNNEVICHHRFEFIHQCLKVALTVPLPGSSSFLRYRQYMPKIQSCCQASL